MIKHLAIIIGKYHIQKVYRCNQAVIATPEKIANQESEVTCKNCLKILKKVE